MKKRAMENHWGITGSSFAVALVVLSVLYSGMALYAETEPATIIDQTTVSIDNVAEWETYITEQGGEVLHVIPRIIVTDEIADYQGGVHDFQKVTFVEIVYRHARSAELRAPENRR